VRVVARREAERDLALLERARERGRRIRRDDEIGLDTAAAVHEPAAGGVELGRRRMRGASARRGAAVRRRVVVLLVLVRRAGGRWGVRGWPSARVGPPVLPGGGRPPGAVPYQTGSAPTSGRRRSPGGPPAVTSDAEALPWSTSTATGHASCCVRGLLASHL